MLAGGSNLVVADEGFPGTVVRIATRGIAREGATLEVAAGEPWDPLVADCVAGGLAGVECLAGIPGSVGATPIQNVGAYGQEVAETISAVRVLDRADGAVRTLAPADCGFTYRSSAFKREPGRWVVLAVSFALEASERSAPIRYPELARALGVEVGARAPLADVREAVLALRRGKGMVLDPERRRHRLGGLVLHQPGARRGRLRGAAGPRRRAPRAPTPRRRRGPMPTGTSRRRPPGSSSAPAFTAATATPRASRSRASTRWR